MTESETPAKDGRDEAGKFVPGNPGGPGRVKGSRNKTTKAVELLLDGEADAITRKAIEMAKEGDHIALRLCMERFAPPRRDNPVTFTIPEFHNASDAVAVLGAVMSAVASGELTPTEAQSVAAVVETYRRTLETEDIERRLAALETRTGKAA